MKNYIKIFVLVCSISFFGCDDYLERYPLNNPSDATFLSNETELRMAVSGCFNGLYFKVHNMQFQLSLDAASDICWYRGATPLQAVGRGAQDSRNVAIVDYWTNLYAGIAKCNYVLANMERCKSVISEASYNQYESEVRFLRALYYSYLTELYGAVPLVTKPLTLSESQMARNSKEEVVNFILAELDQCTANLPQTNKPTSGRVTKGAAWSLASRVALYNKKWDVAISSAQKVMALEGTEYALNNSYMDLFQYAGQSSTEIIFSVQFLKGTMVNGNFGAMGSRNAKASSGHVPSFQLADCWECIDGKQIDESPLFDPKHPYKNRDPRLEYTLAVSGSTYLGFQFETHSDSLLCWDYNQTPAKRIANLDATHAYATFTGICFRKNIDNLDRLTKDENELNTIIIRYAEVLLNYAEAKIESGSIDKSVLDAINKIRQRPTVNMPLITTLDKNELRNALRRERKYELSGEGLRLFDIRRWGIAEDVMTLPVLGRMKKSYPTLAPVVNEIGTAYYSNIPVAQQGESADFKMRVVELRSFNKNRDYLWPIPYIEMDTNPLMEQNPNY